MFTRLIIFIFMFTLALSPLSTEAKGNVDHTSWATPYIQQVVDKHIMSVDEMGQFHPYDNMTRAEAAQIIIQALGLPLDAQIDMKAQDITRNHPQYESFRKLMELGAIDNVPFIKPDAPVTRGQIAKMIAHSFQIEVDGKNVSKFVDVQANDWAKSYIESLADVGIFSGNQQQQFVPHAKLKRGQFAKIIVQAITFKQQIDQLEVAYDYLAKCYIMTPTQNEAWVNETIALINDYRKQQNMSELFVNPKLNQLATIKATDMIERQYFDHYSPYYGHPWDLAFLYDYSFKTFGENLARYMTSPEETVKAWLASDTHRENILRQNYSNTGVAIIKDDEGRYYWVQLFSSDS